MKKFALSRPDIAFTYISDDKEIFSSKGNGDIQEVIGTIYGMDVARNAINISGQDYDYRLTGMYALPID